MFSRTSALKTLREQIADKYDFLKQCNESGMDKEDISFQEGYFHGIEEAIKILNVCQVKLVIIPTETDLLNFMITMNRLNLTMTPISTDVAGWPTVLFTGPRESLVEFIQRNPGNAIAMFLTVEEMINGIYELE